MIGSIYISNYKNLTGLVVPNLSQINLISGKNNIGKSSFLEAIGLHISDSMLLSIVETRGELLRLPVATNDVDYEQKNMNAFASLFKDRNRSISVDNNIRIQDGDIHLIVRFVRYIEVDDNESISKRIVVLTDDNEEMDYKVALEIARDDKNRIILPLKRRYDRTRYMERLKRDDINKLVMVSPANDNDRENARRWDDITLTLKENHVINALRVIEPDLENLAYLEHFPYGERYPVVKVKNVDERLPLRSMGDGINHILSVALALVNCENGCILIDEIDNGLHYTVQTKLWEIIFRLATELNVQVFATTHSSDCISSFSNVLNIDGNQSIGKYIRLENKMGKILANEYTPEELKIVAAQNIEIR